MRVIQLMFSIALEGVCKVILQTAMRRVIGTNRWSREYQISLTVLCEPYWRLHRCFVAGGKLVMVFLIECCTHFDNNCIITHLLNFQAQARCHRIGQQNDVKVYRLITRNSYEREMFDKASLKLGLDKAVLQSMGTMASGSSKGQLAQVSLDFFRLLSVGQASNVHGRC